MRKVPRAAAANSRVHGVSWLKRLVAAGEGQCLEFKRKSSSPDKIVREMVAFANSRGGTVLVGVADDGTLAGLKYPDEDAYILRKAIRRYCRPRLKYSEQFIALSPSRFVLAYDIPPSPRKPHQMVYARTRRECFVRVDDMSIKASREVSEIFRRSALQEGAGFTYGDSERILFRYLSQNPSITLEKFAEISGLKRLIASDKLISLVLTDVLRVTPGERGDVYAFVSI